MLPVLQVLLKQEGRGYNQVTRTINPSTMLCLPEGGTYIIEVRALSEGGEGALSSQVRVVTSSGKPVSLLHTRHMISEIQSLCTSSFLSSFLSYLTISALNWVSTAVW